jgi:hypothetical protein
VTRNGFNATTLLRRMRSAWDGRCRSAVVAWIAVLAVLVQLGASAQQHPAMAGAPPSEAAAALSELTALLGPHVALCERDDGSAPSAPSHEQHKCCDDCALCRLAGHAAALMPPDVFSPIPLAREVAPLGVSNERNVAKPRAVLGAQPRAPPIFA